MTELLKDPIQDKRASAASVQSRSSVATEPEAMEPEVVLVCELVVSEKRSSSVSHKSTGRHSGSMAQLNANLDEAIEEVGSGSSRVSQRLSSGSKSDRRRGSSSKKAEGEEDGARLDSDDMQEDPRTAEEESQMIGESTKRCSTASVESRSSVATEPEATEVDEALVSELDVPKKRSSSVSRKSTGRKSGSMTELLKDPIQDKRASAASVQSRSSVATEPEAMEPEEELVCELVVSEKRSSSVSHKSTGRQSGSLSQLKDPMLDKRTSTASRKSHVLVVPSYNSDEAIEETGSGSRRSSQRRSGSKSDRSSNSIGKKAGAESASNDMQDEPPMTAQEEREDGNILESGTKRCRSEHMSEETNKKTATPKNKAAKPAFKKAKGVSKDWDKIHARQFEKMKSIAPTKAAPGIAAAPNSIANTAAASPQPNVPPKTAHVKPAPMRAITHPAVPVAAPPTILATATTSTATTSATVPAVAPRLNHAKSKSQRGPLAPRTGSARVAVGVSVADSKVAVVGPAAIGVRHAARLLCVCCVVRPCA